MVPLFPDIFDFMKLPIFTNSYPFNDSLHHDRPGCSWNRSTPKRCSMCFGIGFGCVCVCVCILVLRDWMSLYNEARFGWCLIALVMSKQEHMRVWVFSCWMTRWSGNGNWATQRCVSSFGIQLWGLYGRHRLQFDEYYLSEITWQFLIRCLKCYNIWFWIETASACGWSKWA